MTDQGVDQVGGFIGLQLRPEVTGHKVDERPMGAPPIRLVPGKRLPDVCIA